MTNEVQAAAKRLRQVQDANWPVCGFQQMYRIYDGSGWNGNVEAGIADDRMRLADQWLAEHPEDDGEAVTEEWLRSVGFSHDDERPYKWIDGTFTKFDLVAWDDGDWELADADNSIRLVPCINARGDVRRLCAALGIELKEPINDRTA